MDGYELTNHTFESVRGSQRFINWVSQPSQFKSYPHFYRRILLEKESFLAKIAAITAKKQLGKNDFYYLRTNPSAGGLYPNELYVQMRGVDGFEDGIYHFDILGSSLAFLCPVSAYGLESFLADTSEVKGFLFFVSAAYFRSSWKYGDRAIRYCLLDAGHLLGCVEASASVYDMDVLFEPNIDFDGTNKFFGFEDKEFAVCAAIVGERNDKKIEKMPFDLPFVSPYDYFEPNIFVQKWLEGEARKQKTKIASCRYTKTQALEEAIITRRSIRAFYKKPISKTEYETLTNLLNKTNLIKSFWVVNRVDGVQNGLYDSSLVREGDFGAKAARLCLEQALGSDSAVTVFMLAKTDDIWSALLEAGAVAHRIYVSANTLGIGVSGIGAYYDDEVREFVGDKGKVLYALALGN